MNYQVDPIDHQFLSSASHEERLSFYRKTYAHVAGAFLVFLILEAIFLSSEAIIGLGMRITQGYTWLIVLGLFMLVTTQAEKIVARTTDVRKQYAGFFLYILAEAFIFVPLLYIALQILGTEVLGQAFVVTIALFAGLSAVVLITKKDFSFMRSIIVIAGLIAMGLIVAGIAFGFTLGLWFSAAMVLLAAGSILYQTSNMVHRYEKSQHVLAALGLFASFMLLLWYVIRIFLSRD
ncbi:MAG: Bax inhibitor-1/YccA family protein [Bacteroidia bacterium]|nr:Bax inhibitor-1/YccA family protein [Bacteroidia bacterium]